VALDSHEDEDLEKIKQWWKENGTAVILGISLGLAAIFGWRGWQMYQQNQGEAASHLYQQSFNQFRVGQENEARATAERLLTEYSNSTYAALASLMLAAHQAATKGQPEAALAHLDWVINNAKPAALKELAQLRKARILVSEGQIDKALTIVNGTVSDAFKPAYLALKGDILLHQGQPEQAREIYQQALQAEGLAGQQRQWVDLKLNDLGVNTPAVIAQLTETDKTLRDAAPEEIPASSALPMEIPLEIPDIITLDSAPLESPPPQSPAANDSSAPSSSDTANP
jgi:predicted negative regulator of RcsB-dependent stress response